MSNRNKVRFDIKLDEDRLASCWRAAVQSYQNCEFSAGLVSGIPPDTIYLRLDKNERGPTTIFLTPDEALAIINVLTGALWSKEIMGETGEERTKRLRTFRKKSSKRKGDK